MSRSQAVDTRLRIGAVSRLTGLSVHALRKWEERYGAVKPVRTPGGGRLYTREDVQRLALIKSLTQAGAPLSEVARSSLAELEEIGENLLARHAEPVADAPAESLRLAVVGDALPVILGSRQGEVASLEFPALATSLDAARQQLAGESVDLLVQELPSVHEDTVRTLLRSMSSVGAHRAICIYGFASRSALDTLREAGIGLMRAPVDPSELRAHGPRSDVPRSGTPRVRCRRRAAEPNRGNRASAEVFPGSRGPRRSVHTSDALRMPASPGGHHLQSARLRAIQRRMREPQ